MPRIILVLLFLSLSTDFLGVQNSKNQSPTTKTKSSKAKSSEKARLERVRKEAFDDPNDEAKLQAFFALLPKDGERYIVEGDLLFTEQELRVYVRDHATKPKKGKKKLRREELAVALYDNVEDFYKNMTDRTLTFAVDRNSFPQGKDDWYQMVVQNVNAAAREWEAICDICGIRYVHKSEHDADPSHEKVNFIVRYRDLHGKYVALAFFPHDGPLSRYLSVDPSYFTTGYDKVGVMRHELGHTLGYAHEQGRLKDVPGCYYEGDAWKPLTDYDPHSAMHYFCGGRGTLSLAFTEFDKRGHRKQYAPRP